MPLSQNECLSNESCSSHNPAAIHTLRPNPAPNETNRELLVCFLEDENEPFRNGSCFNRKTSLAKQAWTSSLHSLSGKVFEQILDGDVWQRLTLGVARQWQLGGTYLSLFLNSGEVSWYRNSVPRISVQMTAHNIIIHSKEQAMFQLWTFDPSMYNQNTVRFGQPSRIFLTSMCNYTSTSLSLTQCHTAIHSVNLSYVKSDMAATVCRKNLQGVKLPSICEVYCEAAFFFLPETWIHLSKNMFIFPFSLKHIYFLQEINREKKKVWVREVCNKPGFSHQLWNIMTIFDGYDLLGFRNRVNLFSQHVWGKYSYHEGVCIFCSLLHFAIWAGFVLTWHNGKCCAIWARAGVLKGDFCIFLIREVENISM